MIRGSRLKADGWALSPKFSYKVELVLSNRDIRGGGNPEFGNTANIILDAVLIYYINENWSLWFGQTKFKVIESEFIPHKSFNLWIEV